MQISSIYIYPIKSLDGISVKSAELTPRGFKNDRRWMLVDENNQFITQRNITDMCFFDVLQGNSSFTIHHRKTSQTITLSEETAQGKEISVTVWNDTVKAKTVSTKLDDYFSSHLKQKCSLVEMPASTLRLVDKEYAFNNEIVSFADAYPVLMLGEEALKLLSNKTGREMSALRFRPNLVFSGGAAHEEDNFGVFSVGETQLRNAKLCGRCVIPTIKPESGEIEKEVNTILAQYRTIQNKIMFGINCLVNKTGQITIGDAIQRIQ